MSFEIIDVVDENDTVVGTIERTPEWNKSRSTIHRYINVIVKQSDGRFLMQQRAAHRKKPLVFDAPAGGLVPSGMAYEKAAEKELKEELGVEGKLEFVTSFEDLNGTDKISAFAQLFEIISDGPFVPCKEEVERLELFTENELNHMTERFPYLFTSGFLTLWPLYRQIKKF